MTSQRTKRAGGIGDAAVRAKTGKGWAEWFTILDGAGTDRMSHKEIVAYLAEHYPVPPWWQQMVTVAYEQERGLRQKHQTPTGYPVGVSKTIGVPVPTLYRAWQDETARSRWLGDAGIAVRKATPDKSMRATWSDGKTSVDANFYSRGEAKSQVTVQHTKLADAEEVARMREYWRQALGRLQEVLES